jgi:hypothetical protein
MVLMRIDEERPRMLNMIIYNPLILKQADSQVQVLAFQAHPMTLRFPTYFSPFSLLPLHDISLFPVLACFSFHDSALSASMLSSLQCSTGRDPGDDGGKIGPD